MASAPALARQPEQGRLQVPEAAIVYANNPFGGKSSKGKSPFGGFMPEHESVAHPLRHDTDSKLAKAIEAWMKFSFIAPITVYWDDYENAAKLVSGLDFSARELEKLIQEFQALQWVADFSRKTGLILSALINAGSSEKYVVCTRHISTPLSHIGWRNAKHIVIDGNGGDSVGIAMQGGTITVLGDAGNFAGHAMANGVITVEGSAGRCAGHSMRGGTLLVRGNVGSQVGQDMRGGTVIVKGDAGWDVGFVMSGGEIHIQGKYINVGLCITRGKIFAGGVLIYPTPEQVHELSEQVHELVPEPVPEAEAKVELE